MTTRSKPFSSLDDSSEEEPFARNTSTEVESLSISTSLSTEKGQDGLTDCQNGKCLSHFNVFAIEAGASYCLS